MILSVHGAEGDGGGKKTCFYQKRTCSRNTLRTDSNSRGQYYRIFVKKKGNYEDSESPQRDDVKWTVINTVFTFFVHTVELRLLLMFLLIMR